MTAAAPSESLIQEIKERLCYDPTTGRLRWRVSNGRARAGNLAGVIDNIHIKRMVGIHGKMINAVNIIWLLHTGVWPREIIRFRDGNRLNHCWNNLFVIARFCSVSECSSPFHSKGFCKNHLYRFEKYGNPLAGKKSPEKSWGQKKHPLYVVWRGMIKRCTVPSDPGYKNYGARGIFVCKQWLSSFNQFLEDMGDRPEGYTIERKNNSDGYYPENCVWATVTEQARNRRNNTVIKCGLESKTLVEWAEFTGIPRNVIMNRIICGKWDTYRALHTPYIQRSKSNDHV